ncbi:MAG: hypothetical protein LBM87_04455 [Ruminococcus sp.]|nr:hypothetical protein [Ruminococcus sp.]
MVIILITVCTLFTACGGGLDGKYIYTGDKYLGVLGNEIEFNRNEMTYLGIVVVTYSYRNNKLSLIDEASGLELAYSCFEEDDEDVLIIDGDRYEKV